MHPYSLYRIPDSPYWHCYFIDRDGRRVRKSTRETVKARAHEVARQWEHRGSDPTYHAARETTVRAAGRNLEAALRGRGLADQTLQFYGVKLSHVARVFGPDLPLSQIDAKRVDAYIATREREEASPHTIAKELVAIRQLLKHARRRGEYDREVSQVLPVAFASGYVPRERKVTEEDAWRLIEALPPGPSRYAAFVCGTTARDTAARRAVGADRSDRGVLVRDQKTALATRTIPVTRITEPFIAYAFKGLAPTDRVAPGVGGVRAAILRACNRLGLDPLSPNDLRRSVAHWHLAAGVPRDIVARFMGHGSTKMLDLVYGKLDPGELGEAMGRALGPSKVGSTLDNLDASGGRSGPPGHRQGP